MVPVRIEEEGGGVYGMGEGVHGGVWNGGAVTRHWHNALHSGK